MQQALHEDKEGESAEDQHGRRFTWTRQTVLMHRLDISPGPTHRALLHVVGCAWMGEGPR